MGEVGHKHRCFGCVYHNNTTIVELDYIVIAQLDRASASGAEGFGFKSQ